MDFGYMTEEEEAMLEPGKVYLASEAGEVVRQKGMKFDQGKPRLGLIPPMAEVEVAKVLTFGANKYADNNWRKVDNAMTRYMDAALRHINAYRSGETLDSESGLGHLAHATCCLMFMLELEE
jgi:hypothetical protein